MVTRGPGHDAGQFRAAVGAAAARVRIDTLLGDAAFDGENHHAHARDDLGIRSTVFPVYRRGGATDRSGASTAARWSAGSGRGRRARGARG